MYSILLPLLFFFWGPRPSQAKCLARPPLCCAARYSLGPSLFRYAQKLGLAFGHRSAALGRSTILPYKSLLLRPSNDPFYKLRSSSVNIYPPHHPFTRSLGLLGHLLCFLLAPIGGLPPLALWARTA